MGDRTASDVNFVSCGVGNVNGGSSGEWSGGGGKLGVTGGCETVDVGVDSIDVEPQASASLGK